MSVTDGPFCPKFKAFQMLNAFVDELLKEGTENVPSYPIAQGWSYPRHFVETIHKHADLIGAELSKPMYRNGEEKKL